MHKAINELPDQIQTIYELSLKGKSNEEIARVLNLSLDSVKSYKKRGKQILKEKLKEKGGADKTYYLIKDDTEKGVFILKEGPEKTVKGIQGEGVNK